MATLREQLRDTEDVLSLALDRMRELEDTLTGRRRNPERVLNGFLSFVGKKVKKRRTRRKAERAVAQDAVASYRAQKAKAKHTQADKDDDGWFS